MRRPLLLAVLSCLTLTACRRSDRAAGVSDTTFIRTMIALRRVPQKAGSDSARRSAMRDSILHAHRVSAAQLESKARLLAAQPARAQRIFSTIDTATAGSGIIGVAPPTAVVPSTNPAVNPSSAVAVTPSGGRPPVTPGAPPKPIGAADQPNAIRMQSVGDTAKPPAKH